MSQHSACTMETSRVQVVWTAVVCLLLFPLHASGLLPGQNHVLTLYYYSRERYSTLLVFNKYRSRLNEYYQCESGWLSIDNIACNYAICAGLTNLNNACNNYFSNSHIIYTTGVQTYPEGSCDSPDACTCTKHGFYGCGSICCMCTPISNCDMETCTSSSDQTCLRCEGVVQELPGYRAYVASADKRVCNQACSWRSDSTRCYPGTCTNELASQCACATGFSGHHCHTITAPSDIVYNELILTSSSGTDAIAPLDINAGPSALQDDTWTNIVQPASLFYKFETQFIPSLPAYHAYVSDAKIGVIGGKVVVTAKTSGGSTLGLSVERACGGASRDVPERNMFTCQETLQQAAFNASLPMPFVHGNRLEYVFYADNGGFVRIENKETGVYETHYYTGNTFTHTFNVHFDTVDPYHCTGTAACEASMLSLSDILMIPDQTVHWDGWMDDDARVGSYTYQVYELYEVAGLLRHKSIVVSNTITGINRTHWDVVDTSHTFSLTQPGMYAVVFSAHDRATNLKSARRLFLYDDTSEITIIDTTTTPLRVTSAAVVTQWEWQQTTDEIRMTWTGRYVNAFHHNNHLLAEVASEHGVDAAYDDNEGFRSMSAIDNVQAIVRFETAYLIDNQGGRTLSTPPDADFVIEPDLSGTNSYLTGVEDGESLVFWVRSFDVRNVSLDENVTVHVDSSPPVITNLWLTKDHMLNLSVHGLQDLNTMTIEFEAFDIHSGLKVVMWRLYDDFSGQDLVHGLAAVTPQGNTQDQAECEATYGAYNRGPNCYCTGPVGCFHQHFTVQPIVIDGSVNSHGGIFHTDNTATHDYDYYIEITVYNHANLSTTVRRQITVDLSPPHPGVVSDGMAGSPEVDYQSGTLLHAHWSGFFDRESGVKFYQYAFDTQCVDASAFSHVTTDPRVVNMTYETFASWDAPGPGTYYVTVVAYNSAIDPSDPVCSDGVVVDTTPPAVANVFIDGSHIAGGMVSASSGLAGDVWYMDNERRVRPVDSPDPNCISSATSGVPLSMFAVSPLPSPVNGTQLCPLGPMDAKFNNTFYFTNNHHIFLNWTGSDAESGIYDYEVGLATSASAAVPDLSAYTSTHHHEFYHSHHPALSEGSDFYILVRTTNKAGLQSVTSLGPAMLVRTAATYSGSVTVTLTSDILMVEWDNSLFTDVEPDFLKFTVALEEETSGAILHPHLLPHITEPCASATPPSCATFDTADLHWGLHERHVYRAKVKVTNIVGLDLQLTSDPYQHDTRLASQGLVREVVPSGEETALGIERSEDTDYQLSSSTLEAAWSGFQVGSLQVTYQVGLGTTQGADDVSTFIDVSDATQHIFTGLSLVTDDQYYVTVIATTKAGTVTVSSDGVMVIQGDQTETGIVIKDGPVCFSNDSQAWTPEHYGDVLAVPCDDDASFQTSLGTLQAHWDMTPDQQFRYPDVLFSVQRNLPGSIAWYDVTSDTSSPRNDRITAQGLPLQAGARYRLAVKFCVSAVCTLPIFSNGIYVTSSPPIGGSIAVSHSNITGVSTLEVTLKDFRDEDISDLTAAQSALLGYQWSLHHDNDNVHSALTQWAHVTGLTAVNATHSQFTVTLTSELSFHKCLVIAVRGTSRVGLTSTVTSDVMDCEAVGPAPIVPFVVMDTVGDRVEGTMSEGAPVTFGLNDPWVKDDTDFTPHDNILSAVWPLVRNSKVTWAVLESQGPDLTSHFLDPASQNLLDPCSSPLMIACGDVTGQKYVNVFFGNDTNRAALQNGRHYYVCIHTEPENVTYEKWVEELPEVTGCSDGVTIDMTSPVAGTVLVDRLLEGMYQSSVSVVAVRWSGFEDIEELGLTAHQTGIVSYQLAVGSVPGGEDVFKLDDVGLVNSATLHSLYMQDGHVYYVTVQATDHVGRTVSASSKGFVVDSSPPEKTSANFRFAQPYITSVSSLSLCWTDMFTDPGSGIESYVVTVGSRPGHDDIMKGKTFIDDCGELITDVIMINGHAYFVTVGALNGAGLETVATSKPVVTMTTSPHYGHVFDGPPPTGGASPSDVDFVTSQDDVRAFWAGFSSPLAPVRGYSVRLGTCPGCGDVVEDFDIGLTQEISWSHAPLRHDFRYYTTVIACNAVDQCVEVTSDGVMIDDTPPVTGPVWDGVGDEDIAFQSQTDYLGAEWRGFTDLGSGLASFSWRAGTTSGGSDIMADSPLGLVFSAFTKDLPSPLPEGPTIYITVTAYDAAGNTREVTTNGFKVDTSPPVETTAVALTPGVGTLDGVTVVSRDMVGVQWSFADPGSHVAAQYLSIHSHLLGEFQSSLVQIPGPSTQHTFTSLSLHDGGLYNVKVTACNLARLCTTSVSADFLHDNSPPSTGMFAVSTDHSAELGRHVGSWMTWTSSSLRLAWLGFHDQHSGIHGYHVNVGTTPYAKDLNSGSTTATVSQASSNASLFSYEDEGFVQVHEVTTATLSPGQVVHVTVWAVNGVGLKSHPVMSEFELAAGGAMELRRRCQSFNCLSHCSCAVQGAPCGAAATCTQYTPANNPNCLLTVRDQFDLTTLASASSMTSTDGYQASQSYLAATWTVTTSQGLLPIRYEVSVGRANQTTPVGVFDVLEDRVWRDVGLEMSSLVIVPTDGTLTTKVAYSTFVRTWYPDGSYAVFQSPGVTPVIYGPTVTNLVGSAIKEHITSSGTKDVDFVTSPTSVYLSWPGKFISTSAPAQSYRVYVGTRPEAADIFSYGPSSSMAESYHVTGLSLREAIVYYSTVVVEGGSGLLSYAVSDGFLLDTLPPTPGRVMDGTGLNDVDYQSSDSKVKATWHGFYDASSGVRRYFWCVGTTSDSTNCDVMAWTDMGLMTSGKSQLSSPVSQGTTIYSKVYAEDAAGQGSQVAVSDGVKVDTTAPEVLDTVYSNGINFLYNPSFEDDAAQNANLSQCDATPPTSWELTPESCVTLHRPDHVVSMEGWQHAVLTGTLVQTVTGLTVGSKYRLSLRLAHPHNALANQKPVTGHVTLDTVTTPFVLDPSLCRNLCDGDVEPIILWHSFSYIATASSTTANVSISTSVASSDRQVAVDDVILEEIRYVASGGTTSEAGARSSGVFLADWSVVQTSWHVQDDESPIVEYQWALGTSEGGVQLQTFRSVGRRQHAVISGLALTHGTSLHVTLLTRNAAGLTSVEYFDPLTVDRTPPDILDIKDGTTGDDVDFQTGAVIGARWSVNDSESALSHCQWAAGTVPGRGDLVAFQNAATASSGTGSATYSVSADVTSGLSSLPSPATVYVSVRCYNMAGLPARAVTDGVKIVPETQGQTMSAVRILPESSTHFPAQASCHAARDHMRLYWGSVVSDIPVAGFQIDLTSSGDQQSSLTPVLPFLLEAAVLDLNSSLLTADSSYTISVRPVDILGNTGPGTSHVTHVLPDPPAVTADGAVTTSKSGSDLTLQWPNLFTSQVGLSYELTAGSVEGGGDVILFHQTNNASAVISLAHATFPFNMSVVVTAVDTCGQFVTYSQSVAVVP